MQHEPCGFLCDPKSAVNLPATDSVLSIDDHPYCGHPLVESKRGVLKNGSNLDGELLFASLTEPMPPSLNERMLVIAATRTQNPSIWPAKVHGIDESPLRIGEVNDGLL